MPLFQICEIDMKMDSRIMQTHKRVRLDLIVMVFSAPQRDFRVKLSEYMTFR